MQVGTGPGKTTLVSSNPKILKVESYYFRNENYYYNINEIYYLLHIKYQACSLSRQIILSKHAQMLSWIIGHPVHISGVINHTIYFSMDVTEFRAWENHVTLRHYIYFFNVNGNIWTNYILFNSDTHPLPWHTGAALDHVSCAIQVNVCSSPTRV